MSPAAPGWEGPSQGLQQLPLRLSLEDIYAVMGHLLCVKPQGASPGLCAGWRGGRKQLLLEGRTTQVWVRGLGAWGDAAESPRPSSPGEAISLPACSCQGGKQVRPVLPVWLVRAQGRVAVARWVEGPGLGRVQGVRPQPWVRVLGLPWGDSGSRAQRCRVWTLCLCPGLI